LQNVLEPHELDYLASANHRPLAVLQAMSSLLTAAELDANMRCHVDENLTVMEDVLGACERILRTPIPLSYTRCERGPC
jgi:predicted membrane chloride channel (bestrophin family)